MQFNRNLLPPLLDWNHPDFIQILSWWFQSSQVCSKFRLSPAMVRTSRLATRLLASADTKQLEKGLLMIIRLWRKSLKNWNCFAILFYCLIFLSNRKGNVFLSDRIPRYDAIVITRWRSTYQYTHSSASFRNPFQFGVCVTNDLAIASFSCMDR